MKNVHLSHKPSIYFEIGTQKGKSLAIANCLSISVDPEYILEHNFLGKKEAVLLFQQTSDDFFADPIFAHTNWKIDLAFLDGMHLYEYLLRDFIFTEKFMAKDGIIFLHDCMPWNTEMAMRERCTNDWTGDVWKLVPILQKYRPDLKITLYDAAPTGLVAIENLNPNHNALEENYDHIIAEFDKVIDPEQIVNGFEITSTDLSPWT